MFQTDMDQFHGTGSHAVVILVDKRSIKHKKPPFFRWFHSSLKMPKNVEFTRKNKKAPDRI